MQSLFWACCQCNNEFKTILPNALYVLIYVETNWSGSLFAIAVLGCRSLVLVT